MSTSSTLTTRRVIFPDGSFAKITQDLEPEPGEPILMGVTWEHGSGMLPVQIIDEILDGWQSHADLHQVAFRQCMTFPSGRTIHLRFRPMKPCESCEPSPGSVIGTGLFDAPPAAADEIKSPADYRKELLAAMQKIMPPERLAQAFADLPLDAQRRIAKQYLIDPPVRRITKINKRRP